MSGSGEISQGAFWAALGQRPIGATVVTCRGAEGPQGFLGLSAAHVSAAPPRMLVSVSESTSAYAALIETGAFAINVMPAESEAAVAGFGSKTVSASERFSDPRWGTLETGAPVFGDALSVFDCVVAETLMLSGVAVVIGDVVALRTAPAPQPALVAHKGGFLPLG